MGADAHEHFSTESVSLLLTLSWPVPHETGWVICGGAVSDDSSCYCPMFFFISRAEDSLSHTCVIISLEISGLPKGGDMCTYIGLCMGSRGNLLVMVRTVLFILHSDDFLSKFIVAEFGRHGYNNVGIAFMIEYRVS